MSDPSGSAGRGRLAEVLAMRGGRAEPEAPFVIEHREALIYMLCQAAELEHGLTRHYPAGVNLTLVPFGEPGIQHFMFLERPEGMALEGDKGIDAPVHEAVPLMAEGDIVPQLQDFATIGHLYRSIEHGLAHLTEKFGE